MKFIFVLYLFLLAGIISINAQVSSDSLYNEAYRSQYHFSPQKVGLVILVVLYITKGSITCIGGER